jgi:hypothetical protein
LSLNTRVRPSVSVFVRRLAWRRRLSALGVALVAVCLAAVALSGVLRTRRDLERCRRGYAAARTAAESLLVDRQPVEDRPPKHPVTMRLQYCRVTRSGSDLGPLVERQPNQLVPP